MKWVVVVAIAVVAVTGCRSDPDAKARAEKANEEKATQAREARERNADWGKATRDAGRMEEKSRQRAEQQRQQMLDKANKEAEKQ